MKISVAGAGAGKTTKMAESITQYSATTPKLIFCVAFTNAAARNIQEKVISEHGAIPNNIKISTIHSFLYRELIEPYYWLLYNIHFEAISLINLPSEASYKRSKLSELERKNLLHVTSIPEKAKWVAFKKSGDNIKTRILRERILTRISSYCSAIFVDEAQDMSRDIGAIISALDTAGIDIFLYGDPKQDVRGFGTFRSLIDCTATTSYVTDCYRSPQLHINISNKLACDSEKQIADAMNSKGSIDVVFEEELDDVKSYFDSHDFGLSYISKKTRLFTTHIHDHNKRRFNSLNYEVLEAMKSKWKSSKSELEIQRLAFYVTEQMLQSFDIGADKIEIIAYWVRQGVFFKLDKQSYAKMVTCFVSNNEGSSETIKVNSIESIKGLEAEKCLFILTPDLASYLFNDKTVDNKTKHLLYVALTRSLDNLTFLVTMETQKKFNKEFINEFFNGYIVQ